MLELENVDGDQKLLADIQNVIEEVPVYPDHNYGTSQDTTKALKELAQDTPPGVSIEVARVDALSVSDSESAPVMATSVELGGDGETVYFKGAHRNEVVHQRTAVELVKLACRNPRLWLSLGVSRFVYCDSDPVGSDENSWHRQPAFAQNPLGAYLRWASRHPDSEWDHPALDANGEYRAPATESARISQRLIEDLKPTILYPLHNATMNGPYAYVANDLPGQANNVAALLKGLYGRFPSGDPDTPESTRLNEYVHKLPNWQGLLASANPFAQCMVRNWGQDSLGYARDVSGGEVTSVITEVPYFLPMNYLEEHPSGLTTADVRSQTLDDGERLFDDTDKWLTQAKKKGSSDELAGVELGIGMFRDYILPAMRERFADLPADKPWSVAEVARASTAHFYWLIPLGGLHKAIRRFDSATPFLADIDERLNREVALAEKRLDPVLDRPRRLVQAQLGAVLHTHLALVQAG